MSNRRPKIWNFAAAFAFAASVAIAVGSAPGIREVRAEGYFSDGLYWSAARTFVMASSPSVLKVFAATFGGLLSLVVLMGIGKIAFHRFAPQLGSPPRTPAGLALRKITAPLASTGRILDPAGISGLITRMTCVILAIVLGSTWGGIYAFSKRASLPPEGTPNVLLIVLDTLRPDHIGAYGRFDSPTPNLDEFAEECFLFQNAYSPSSWTRPSVASILTSRLPTDHRITTEARHQIVPRHLTTLPEILRDLGYSTGAFLTNPHYKYGLEEGFDTLEYHGNMRAAEIYERAGSFLDDLDGDPFFLLVHNNDPHDAYEYRPGFSRNPADSPYRKLNGLLPSHRNAGGVRMDTPEYWEGIRRLSPAALAEMKQNYDDEISYLDHHLGEFLAEFQRRGLLDNTIVALVADHGEEFLDHGSYWHGGTLYEELIRVPMLIKAPGIGAGVVSERVSSVDLMPTLLELLGAQRGPVDEFHGRSLVPALRGEALPEKPILGVTAFRGDLKYSLIDGGMKLIRYANGETIGLFDLEEDPGEKFDRSGEDPETLLALERKLTQMIGNAFSSTNRREQTQRSAPRLDEGTRKQLQELGYLVD